MHESEQPKPTQSTEVSANCSSRSGGTAALTVRADLEGVATMIAKGED